MHIKGRKISTLKVSWGQKHTTEIRSVLILCSCMEKKQQHMQPVLIRKYLKTVTWAHYKMTVDEISKSNKRLDLD